MTVTVRAADPNGPLPHPLVRQIECSGCKAPGPSAIWTLPRPFPATIDAALAAEALTMGWRKIERADGGHYPRWLCRVCAGGLR